MNKKLSQIALFLMVLTNINPVMAASKTPNADLSTQKLEAVENPNNMIVAQFWRDIQRTVNTVNEVTNTVDAITNPRNNRNQMRNVQQPQRINKLQEQRKAYQEERKKLQAERDEQKKQYLESLSPEERSAFLQREQEQKAQMMRTLVEGAMIIAPMMMENDNPNTGRRTQLVNCDKSYDCL
ncbi:hypothetical protein [Anabaena sp. CCY 0017]|uniref:hypothetical protein n=1 Tax=Anabaena sp. CCY 0017 TaxID=3103866 RepID=UPI0039C5E9C9